MRQENLNKMYPHNVFLNVLFDKYCSKYYRNLLSNHTKKPKAMQLYLWCGQRKYKLNVTALQICAVILQWKCSKVPANQSLTEFQKATKAHESEKVYFWQWKYLQRTSYKYCELCWIEFINITFALHNKPQLGVYL